MHQWDYTTREVNTNMSFTFNGTTPAQIAQWATPLEYREQILPNLGLFAQDQWSVRRVTLNLGVRYDHIHGMVPAQELGAGQFVSARSYAEVDNVPNYHDLSPRLGVAYDIFGNGKTAVKASLGRYLLGIGAQTPIGRTANPVQAAVNNVTRSWNDANRNYVPDCDLTNRLANGECGQVSDLNFGNPSRATTAFDPDAVSGWGHRGYNWEGLVGIQHEVSTGVSVGATYARRWYGNFFVTQNTSLAPANFDSYCITAPANANLQDGGGYQVCGLYDVMPAFFGRNTYLIGRDLGRIQDVYNGIDFTVSARLPNKIFVSGGTSTGRERTNDCALLNQPNLAAGLLVNGVANTVQGFVGSASGIYSPNLPAYCDIEPPFQTYVKGLAVYPLPWWGLQTSATFQSLPGVARNATYSVSSAAALPSLGRSLSTGTVVVDLVPPNSLFTDRINQTNVRFEKMFAVSRTKLKAMIDLFNIFNQNPVLGLNTRVSATSTTYPTPTFVEPARMVKFSAQWDF